MDDHPSLAEISQDPIVSGEETIFRDSTALIRHLIAETGVSLHSMVFRRSRRWGYVIMARVIDKSGSPEASIPSYIITWAQDKEPSSVKVLWTYDVPPYGGK